MALHDEQFSIVIKKTQAGGLSDLRSSACFALLALVHRFRNNYTIHLPANPIAQVEKPRRSPLRLRFYTCTLESVSYAIGIVIYETMY